MQQDAEKSEFLPKTPVRTFSGFPGLSGIPSSRCSGKRSSPRREPTIDPFYVFVTLLLKKKKDFRDSNCIIVIFNSIPVVPVPSSQPVLTSPINARHNSNSNNTCENSSKIANSTVKENKKTHFVTRSSRVRHSCVTVKKGGDDLVRRQKPQLEK